VKSSLIISNNLFNTEINFQLSYEKKNGEIENVHSTFEIEKIQRVPGATGCQRKSSSVEALGD
jgi:hypothetical protein